jgi:predicted ATP-dependent endonuclease of OLD family
MLVPHFIRSRSFSDLDKSYLTILEIGGSHAHQLRPLVEKLELTTLVITDLDPIKQDSNEKCPPEKGKNLRTRNSSIKSWAPGKTELDAVLAATKNEKTTIDGNVCVAYQCAVLVRLGKNKPTEAIPYTFEDSLVLANLDFFKDQNKANGLMGKMATAANEVTINEMCKSMYGALESGNKAEMALELLYQKDPKELEPPEYIREGLEWLQKKLKAKAHEFPESSNAERTS